MNYVLVFTFLLIGLSGHSQQKYYTAISSFPDVYFVNAKSGQIDSEITIPTKFGKLVGLKYDSTMQNAYAFCSLGILAINIEKEEIINSIALSTEIRGASYNSFSNEAYLASDSVVYEIDLLSFEIIKNIKPKNPFHQSYETKRPRLYSVSCDGKCMFLYQQKKHLVGIIDYFVSFDIHTQSQEILVENSHDNWHYTMDSLKGYIRAFKRNDLLCNTFERQIIVDQQNPVFSDYSIKTKYCSSIWSMKVVDFEQDTLYPFPASQEYLPQGPPVLPDNPSNRDRKQYSAALTTYNLEQQSWGSNESEKREAYEAEKSKTYASVKSFNAQRLVIQVSKDNFKSNFQFEITGSKKGDTQIFDDSILVYRRNDDILVAYDLNERKLVWELYTDF